MAQSVADRVVEIIAEQAMLDVADIRMDSSPDKLGIDSLGLVEAVFAIEEGFDVEVPFNANEPGEGNFDFSSVAAIVAGVEALIREQREGGAQ